MKKRSAKITVLILGLILLGMGGFQLINSLGQVSDLARAEGVITGFHFHEGNPNAYHPNMIFIYQGDTVFIEGDTDEEGQQTGKHVTLVFPPAKPQEASILSVPWFFSAVLMLAGIWCLGTVGYLRLLESTATLKKKKAQDSVEPKRISNVPGLLLFSLLAILLTCLTYFLTVRKLAHPDNETEWGGLIGLGIIAFLFVAMCLLNWWGLILESRVIRVEADFTRVIGPYRELTLAGEVNYYWKIKCEWINPLTNSLVTFTSGYVKGTELYYTQPKISVYTNPVRPEYMYVIDLSYLSHIPGKGITIVDPSVRETLDKQETRWVNAVKSGHQKSLRGKVGRKLNWLLDWFQRNPRRAKAITIFSLVTGIGAKAGKAETDKFEIDFED